MSYTLCEVRIGTAMARSWRGVFGREICFEMGRNCDSITTSGGEGLACMWSANVRRRSRVKCCSDLRKCSARVEERRLIARNDRALYLELVVAVVILLSPLVVIQYNKQKQCPNYTVSARQYMCLKVVRLRTRCVALLALGA